MQIKDLKPNSPIDEIEVVVESIEEPREFISYRGRGRVVNASVRDETGRVKLTLWNDDVDRISPGSRVRIENGWAREYRGELQIGVGKFGKLFVKDAR
ncbi:MAG: DNA-binding protein [Candidatus Altiarchaeales archaeon]|nr:MAG: DNA-binding protein [Candidatus Altiarchaeales archaeon]RLI94951.1 MAG: DNA-binding protein [Candidatus Altiarchaeales archaeon]HDO82333.1 DNA-binding protein [Candidatus Altiarchaeales archaeon]HEX54982.1 DNA-binding protein [Candidatus Altiarchaeales archaeon]